MDLAITITGTRSTEHRHRSDLEELFAAFLQPFADSSRRFYLGGARGIDALALTWLAEHSRCPLAVVVPTRLADQPADAVQAVVAARNAGRVDELAELGAAETTAAAYHARNRWMVNRSGFVIGFPHGDDQRSGTWYTLRYAAGRGLPRLIVPV